MNEREWNLNIYRYQFVSHCPNNERPIIYSLEIETTEVIHVEHIMTAAALHESSYHEEIANDMHERFKGRQVIKANHHGVDIETRRGFYDDSGARIPERIVMGKVVFEKGVTVSAVVNSLHRLTSAEAEQIESIYSGECPR